MLKKFGLQAVILLIGVGVFAAVSLNDFLRFWGDFDAVRDGVAGDPDDAGLIGDDRHAVALFSGDFGVDEDVLQFFLAAEAERAEAIAGLA